MGFILSISCSHICMHAYEWIWMNCLFNIGLICNLWASIQTLRDALSKRSVHLMPTQCSTVSLVWCVEEKSKQLQSSQILLLNVWNEPLKTYGCDKYVNILPLLKNSSLNHIGWHWCNNLDHIKTTTKKCQNVSHSSLKKTIWLDFIKVITTVSFALTIWWQLFAHDVRFKIMIILLVQFMHFFFIKIKHPQWYTCDIFIYSFIFLSLQSFTLLDYMIDTVLHGKYLSVLLLFLCKYYCLYSTSKMCKN